MSIGVTTVYVAECSTYLIWIGLVASLAIAERGIQGASSVSFLRLLVLSIVLFSFASLQYCFEDFVVSEFARGFHHLGNVLCPLNFIPTL